MTHRLDWLCHQFHRTIRQILLPRQLQGCWSRGEPGGGHPDLDYLVNPIPTRGADCSHRINTCLPQPQIFKPSYGPALHFNKHHCIDIKHQNSRIVKIHLLSLVVILSFQFYGFDNLQTLIIAIANLVQLPNSCRSYAWAMAVTIKVLVTIIREKLTLLKAMICSR